VHVQSPPTAAELIEPGRLFQHYKGDFYRIITLGALSEERETWMVVYRSLKYGSVWIRPLTMFLEIVEWPDGTQRPRFSVVTQLPRHAEVPYLHQL
jgi:hypothetical protein